MLGFIFLFLHFKTTTIYEAHQGVANDYIFILFYFLTSRCFNFLEI